MDKRKLKILRAIADLDQEENRQRDWASKQSYSRDQDLVETQRQREYEDKREKLVREYHSPPETGSQAGHFRTAFDQVTKVQVR